MAIESGRFYRFSQVAQELNVSESTVFRWTKSGELPVKRFPGVRSVRIPGEAIIKKILSDDCQETSGSVQRHHKK